MHYSKISVSLGWWNVLLQDSVISSTVVFVIYVFFCYRVFKRVDQKGDKKIDLSEFRAALHNQGIYVAPEIEQQCFDQIDRDKSGTLDLDEFIIALRVSIFLVTTCAIAIHLESWWDFVLFPE